MDNFMDKLAQKLTSSEIIKANSAADAAELERLQKQLDQYDACLQEMRKLSLRNVENTDKIGELLDESVQKIQSFQAGDKDFARLEEQMQMQLQEQGTMLTALEERIKTNFRRSEEELASLKEEMRTAMEGMKPSAEEIVPSMEEMLEKSNDFVHKENVKVYRNVQAVVVEETKKQTEALEPVLKKSTGKVKATFVFAVLAFIAAAADLVLNLLIYFKIL